MNYLIFVLVLVIYQSKFKECNCQLFNNIANQIDRGNVLGLFPPIPLIPPISFPQSQHPTRNHHSWPGHHHRYDSYPIFPSRSHPHGNDHNRIDDEHSKQTENGASGKYGDGDPSTIRQSPNVEDMGSNTMSTTTEIVSKEININDNANGGTLDGEKVGQHPKTDTLSASTQTTENSLETKTESSKSVTSGKTTLPVEGTSESSTTSAATTSIDESDSSENVPVPVNGGRTIFRVPKRCKTDKSGNCRKQW